MIFIHLFIFIFLHFSPRSVLNSFLKILINLKDFYFIPTFFGRCAFYEICYNLKNRSIKEAYIPDYICNVVAQAIEKADLKITPYSLDSYFEPNIDQLHKIILEKKNVILVLVNLFGSSGSIEWLNKENTRKNIIKNNIHIILDLCQDLNLRYRIPKNYYNNLIAIISFNNKSIPGIMGGGILSEVPLKMDTKEKLTKKHNLIIYLRYFSLFYKFFRINKIFRFFKRKSNYIQAENNNFYDYSTSNYFPFEFKNYYLSKCQISIILAGFILLPWINSKKIKFIERNKKNILLLNHSKTACFLIQTNHDTLENYKVKKSYAIYNSPNISLRPNLKIIYNKGYIDL